MLFFHISHSYPASGLIPSCVPVTLPATVRSDPAKTRKNDPVNMNQKRAKMTANRLMSLIMMRVRIRK